METIAFFQQGLLLVMVLSAPPLIVGTIVGIIWSILQALLQIQDQTPSFVVKLVAVGATLALSGRWIGSELLLLSQTAFSMIPLIGR